MTLRILLNLTRRWSVVCTVLLLMYLSSAQGANPRQAAPDDKADAARVDQLITECRQLMAKSAFAEIYPKAQEALSLSQKLNDKTREARSLTYVALGEFHAGDIEDAIEPFQRAARLAGEAGETRLQLTALNSAGVLLLSAGRLDDALYFLEQSLALCRDAKDTRSSIPVLRNIAEIYRATRDFTRSQQYLTEALELARSAHDVLQERAALSSFGVMETARGNLQIGLNYQLEALKLENASTPVASKFQLRNELARAYLEVGDLANSESSFRQALELAQSLKIPQAEAVVLGNLAHVQLNRGNAADARDTCRRALTLLRKTGTDPADESVFLLTQARAEHALGKPDDAIASLRTAIAQLERSRLGALSTESARAELFGSRADVFTAAIDLLVTQNKQADALTIAEAYHGRAFLESLVEARADLRRLAPKSVLDREDEILNRISAAQRQLWQENLSSAREEQLQKELAKAEDELAKFRIELRHSSPQYASVKHIKPLSGEEIRNGVLDATTALVEYVVGDEHTYAWAVSNKGVSMAQLPGRRQLTALVSDYTKLLGDHSAGPMAARTNTSLRAKARSLYEVLLKPFEADFNSAKSLLIVPDGALSYVPFESLVMPMAGGKEGYLVEHFSVSYEPSASAFEALRSVPFEEPPDALIAFGDPNYEGRAESIRSSPKLAYYTERGVELRRLPYTRREVTSIGALFPAVRTRIFLGEQANEENLKTANLSDFRFVHFAAHGIVDQENPSRSGIVLSLDGGRKEDGILQIPEIMRLKLNADMVTLSACRTALGKNVSGEGMLGLTRAFMYAGSRSVVASLWNVNDTATAELMTVFYQKLKSGASKDDALRQAKLSMLKGKQLNWHHPYFWASFVLVGMPR